MERIAHNQFAPDLNTSSVPQTHDFMHPAGCADSPINFTALGGNGPRRTCKHLCRRGWGRGSTVRIERADGRKLFNTHRGFSEPVVKFCNNQAVKRIMASLKVCPVGVIDVLFGPRQWERYAGFATL